MSRIQFQNFLKDDNGTGLQEYVMAAACIALVILTSVGLISNGMNSTYNTINTSVGNVVTASTATVTGPVNGGVGGQAK